MSNNVSRRSWIFRGVLVIDLATAVRTLVHTLAPRKIVCDEASLEISIIKVYFIYHDNF